MRDIAKFLKKRPAVKFVLLAISGLLIGKYVDVVPLVLFFTLITLSIAATVLHCVKNSLANYFLIVTFILAGFLIYEVATHVFPPNHITHFLDSNESVTVTGTVVGFPHQKRDRVEIEVQTQAIVQGTVRDETRGKILVRIWQDDFFPAYGDQIEIYGKLNQPRGERNPGDFDYQKFLAAAGIHGIMNIYNPETITLVRASPKKSISYFIFQVKHKFYFAIEKLYHGNVQAIMKALLLGERGEITPELKEAFINCGVIHALAISGLHVGYILFIFFTLFSLARFSYEARIIAVLVSLLMYVLIIGFQPPIVRASLMAGIFLIGRLLQRQTDAFNVIASAALIILILKPQQFFQASFQLSFMAVISIVFLYQRFKNVAEKSTLFAKLLEHKLGNLAGKLFLVTLAAQLGTLPLVAYYFHRVSLISFLMNLLVIPLLGIIIALGLLSMFVALVSIPVAQLYANTNAVILETLIRILEKFGSYTFSAIEVSKVGVIIIFGYYILLWIIINLDRKIYRKAFAFSLLFILLFFAWKPIFSSGKWMQVIFFDVGQGDAALITFPDGKNMLIDSGPTFEDFDAGNAFIVPYLKRERIKKIDAVILTHADLDHIGGMPSIFRSLPVKKIYDNGILQASAICSVYNHVIDSLKIPRETVLAGQRLMESGKWGLFVLHPGRSFIEKNNVNSNNSSIVVKVIYGEISFLFAGDIEEEAENLLLNYGDLLQSKVLKISHHGSKTSSSLALLQCVQPEYAVISVGKNNRFNLPDSMVLSRLRSLGIKTLRTDINGAVVFRTDGIRLQRTR